MPKIISIDDIKNKFVDCQIKILNKDYKGIRNKLSIQCVNKKCNYIWYASLDKLKKNRYCIKCKQKKTTKAVKDFLKNKNIKMLSVHYINAHQKLNLYCLICNYKWDATFTSLKHAMTGCPNCAGVIKYTQDEINAYLINIDIKILSQFVCVDKKIDLQCIKCCNIWATTFNLIKSQHTGCPSCNKCGKGERLTGLYLKDLLNIDINNQFLIRINDKKYRKKIYVDFSFKIDQTVFMVEYNGIQHYEYNSYFHTEAEFENQRRRDRWLKKYCKSNDIELIIVDGRKYKDKNIFNFLYKQLKKRKITCHKSQLEK